MLWEPANDADWKELDYFEDNDHQETWHGDTGDEYELHPVDNRAYQGDRSLANPTYSACKLFIGSEAADQPETLPHPVRIGSHVAFNLYIEQVCPFSRDLNNKIVFRYGYPGTESWQDDHGYALSMDWYSGEVVLEDHRWDGAIIDQTQVDLPVEEWLRVDVIWDDGTYGGEYADNWVRIQDETGITLLTLSGNHMIDDFTLIQNDGIGIGMFYTGYNIPYLDYLRLR